MTEADVIAWFAAHPFTHSIVAAGVGAVVAAYKHDRESLEKARETDPKTEFSWYVAFRRYAVAGAFAAGAIVIGEAVHIVLGAGA